MRTRMKDIARDLGVSTMTVSKVLRNHPDIGEETRERVLKRIRELNYTPNAAAQALVTGRSNVVALVVPDLVHPFFAEVARGVSGVLRQSGYSLVISSSEDDPALERKEIEHLLARSVDALMVASVQTSTESFRRIEESQTPYVLIDRRIPDLTANFIGIDDELAGRVATEHLIEIGRRRIAHIGGSGTSIAQGRLTGYRQTLARHGLSIPEGYVICRAHADDFGDVSGYQAMQQLLHADLRPDGVFCHNDPTAMGVMLAIVEAGLRIPEDIAVIGCGDVHYAKFLRVPLTTVSQQSTEMGRRAGELALALVGSEIAVGTKATILMEPRLLVRDSTAGTAADSARIRSGFAAS